MERKKGCWHFPHTQVQRLEQTLDQVRASEYTMDEVLNKMLEPRQNVKSDREYLDTAMHLACRKGNVAVVRCLLAAGARSNVPGATRVPGATCETASQAAHRLEKAGFNTLQFRQIKELLAEPLPTCFRGHRCV